MPKKFKQIRIVTFEEDYVSDASKKEAAKNKTTAEPIYKAGSTHAMHENIAAKLERKGAKIKISKFDKEAEVKKIRRQIKSDERDDD